MVVPLFGAPTQAPSKNREMDGDLDLGCHQLIKTPNNQPIVRGIGRRDVIVEEAGGGRGRGGGQRSIV